MPTDLFSEEGYKRDFNNLSKIKNALEKGRF